MLDAVLAAYLDSLTEREFDAPFLTLLRAMGFEEIHFTHGDAEFGKDFIAKKEVDGQRVQFAFQNKAGRVSQSTWRSELQPQVLEALTTGLSHPNFDKTLPRQVIAVTSGRFSNNAAISAQAFNTDMVPRLRGARPIEVWDQEKLIPLLKKHGLEGVHPANSAGYRAFAKFFELYGRLSDRLATPRELERYSREWMVVPGDPDPSLNRLMFRAVCEASILSKRLADLKEHYLAAHLWVCALRAVWWLAHSTGTLSRSSRGAADACLAMFKGHARVYCDDVSALSGDETGAMCSGQGAFITYPVTCARFLELVSLLVLLEESDDNANSARLAQFLQREPGCARPPSDAQAISLVLATLALVKTGRRDQAASLLKGVVKWVCDRLEQSQGLADLEAEPTDEFCALVFGCGRNQSYLATTLVDIAAFLGDGGLYSDIVNDFLAVDAVPQCYVPKDTPGQYQLDGEDVLQFPNLEFRDELAAGQAHGEHLTEHAASYLAQREKRPIDLLIIATVLRDRHFPTIWPSLSAKA